MGACKIHSYVLYKIYKTLVHYEIVTNYELYRHRTHCSAI
jgi:hypothetical protein